MSEQSLYLVMVTENNNNKFYRMIPEGDTFRVEYGRIGNDYFATDSYHISEWDKKLREKLRKGYVDQTRLVAVPTEPKNTDRKYSNISIKEIAIIVEKLQRMANQAIRNNYTISSTGVTQLMIDEAQDLLNKLNFINGDLKEFNSILMDLFHTIPRRMDNVTNYLAYRNVDFVRIVHREQDLLDVMRGQVVQQDMGIDNEDSAKEAGQTVLETLGLQFIPVSEQDNRIIKNNLGELRDKFRNAWCVINNKTQARFDHFVAQNNIDNKKLLWHGSRNENWWSIIGTGLVLRPNAVITGKMFGDGIYFAPSAKKSFGYTSFSGSYWARGNSPFGYMSLFDVAYGIPYDVYDRGYFSDMNYEKLQQKKKGAHSLHAHAGAGLYNDEIIVYKENQITIKYLVEFV